MGAGSTSMAGGIRGRVTLTREVGSEVGSGVGFLASGGAQKATGRSGVEVGFSRDVPRGGR